MSTTLPLTAKSIDRAIRAALIEEFGVGTNLSDVLLHEIEDVVYSVLTAAGRGVDEANESAARIAARLDGKVVR